MSRLWFALTLLAIATPATALDVALYGKILERHTREVEDLARTRVDYSALASSQDWVRLVASLGAANPTDLTSQKEQLAFWINAYNAWMLRAVLDAYPVASVNDIPGDNGVFDAKGRICGGEDFSLNEIEHEIVRKEFLEPRAHFALNCASMSCPQLPTEAFVPERLGLRNGRTLRMRYEHGREPVGSILLQHLYDVGETPTIADGRIKVIIEVLAPNHRPIQATKDLRSFWETSYPQIKKDLKGRYPRHEWR